MALNLSATLAFSVLFALVTLSLSLVIFAYERTLVPLYGYGPTNYLLSTLLLGVVLLSALYPSHIPRRRSLLFTAVTLSISPKATYWIGVLTSRLHQPTFGPAVTHLVVLGPLVFTQAIFLLHGGNKYHSEWLRSRAWALSTVLLYWWLAAQLSRKLWPLIVPLRGVSDNQISLSLAFLSYSAWIISYLDATPFHRLAKQKPNTRRTNFLSLVAFAALWILAYPVLKSPILPHPLSAPYTRPDYPLRILSAVQSVTGLITVAEALPPDGHTRDVNIHSMRYLRASHSILGGVWMNDNVRVLDNERPLMDSYGTYLGDSIYAAFVLQEAVRLVNSSVAGNKGRLKEGLIIGLGAGISATAFNRHRVLTTIVEIDPAVYEAARRYFGLPDPGAGRVFLEDARAWVSRQRLSIESSGVGTRFDFVIHDCFSGGGVPEHIYTIEFWNDLKLLMEPEGILAVNYAGTTKSESSQWILRTLVQAFEHCRVFHDLPEELPAEKYANTFSNMVIFCTRSMTPLAFREAEKSDYLGSPLRRRVLTSLMEREIDISNILEFRGHDQYVLRDKHNPLGQIQEAQAHHHWTIMRKVLPDPHWETF